MAIKEARVSTVKSMLDQSALGKRILAMRHYPRGFSKTNVDIWLPDAGPSEELLAAYHKKEVDWTEFTQSYKAEQSSATRCRIVRYDSDPKTDIVVNRSPLTVIREFEREYGDVSVMCIEECLCHRFLLVALALEVAA